MDKIQAHLPRVRQSFKLSHAFSKFYEEVWFERGPEEHFNYRKKGNDMQVVSPEHIKQEIYTKFSPVFQHDCHEFFTYIMSTL